MNGGASSGNDGPGQNPPVGPAGRWAEMYVRMPASTRGLLPDGDGVKERRIARPTPDSGPEIRKPRGPLAPSSTRYADRRQAEPKGRLIHVLDRGIPDGAQQHHTEAGRGALLVPMDQPEDGVGDGGVDAGRQP